ncbi:hypothetical protein BKP42_44740 [Rhodococcus erythropolis]|nr:hypothetical protein BKP42_44740 [Rhodococcus erythropolis]
MYFDGKVELVLQHDSRIDAKSLDLLVLGEDLVLRGSEDGIEAPQDRERQDHVAVLIRLVGAAQ